MGKLDQGFKMYPPEKDNMALKMNDIFQFQAKIWRSLHFSEGLEVLRIVSGSKFARNHSNLLASCGAITLELCHDTEHQKVAEQDF